MKLISFCIFGNNPLYTIGAIKNADLALSIYSDWVCRFYYDITTPLPIIFELQKRKNVELVKINEIGDRNFTLYRFLPISEDNIEYFISRDTDSRLGMREKFAVDEWIKSGKSIHIMRDHPFHNYPIMAGMFGIKGNIIKNIKEKIDNEIKTNEYFIDRDFLIKNILQFIEKDDIIIHDEFFNGKSFPTKRKGLEFVGKIFDNNEKTVLEHEIVLKNELIKRGMYEN